MVTARCGAPHARLGAALIALFAAGCSGKRPASAVSTAPGTTTILVENHLGSPDTLDRLLVAIDGADIPLGSLPPPEEAPLAVASLRLRPGSHSISIRATARGAGEGIVVVAAQQLFHVAEAPAAINVNVRHRREAIDTEGRIAVDLRMRGGKMAEEFGAAPPEDKDERCAPLGLIIPRAICRAAADLAEAARRDDIKSTLCVRDKLAEMRRLAQIADAASSETTRLAEQQVASLSREVDRCVGDTVLVAPDGVTVTRPRAPQRKGDFALPVPSAP
jgi:hypothetical protein